jgi:dihydroflavonol-4-reductase
MNVNGKILVTGGTGFLGAYLLPLLCDKGYAVRATMRKGSSFQMVERIRHQVEWVEADIRDVIALESAFEGVTHVIHCAALVSFDPRDFRRMHQINAEGTANVVNLSLDFDVQKLLHVSSIAALGRSKERPHLDESAKWLTSPDNSQYAISKYQAEQEVRRGEAEGLQVSIVNPSVIVGAQPWDQGMARFFPQIDKGLPLSPSGSSGFVDVRDVARFMLHVLESDLQGERYILNASNLLHREFFGMIAAELGRKAPSIIIGPKLMELAWRVDWLKSTILRKSRQVTKESGRAAVSNYTYANEKSKAVFGFQYTPIEQTLREMALLYKDGRKILFE